MKCTLKPLSFYCWKYERDADRPLWVVKRCHNLLAGMGGETHGALTMRAAPGNPELMVAVPGQWIVMNTVTEVIIVFDQEEFEIAFDIVEENQNVAG